MVASSAPKAVVQHVELFDREYNDSAVGKPRNWRASWTCLLTLVVMLLLSLASRALGEPSDVHWAPGEWIYLLRVASLGINAGYAPGRVPLGAGVSADLVSVAFGRDLGPDFVSGYGVAVGTQLIDIWYVLPTRGRQRLYFVPLPLQVHLTKGVTGPSRSTSPVFTVSSSLGFSLTALVGALRISEEWKLGRLGLVAELCGRFWEDREYDWSDASVGVGVRVGSGGWGMLGAKKAKDAGKN